MSPQEAASRDMASKYHYKMLCASEYSMDLCMLPWPLYFAMVNFAMITRFIKAASHVNNVPPS